MTTLQEAAMRKALEALEAPTPGAITGSAESWSIWYDKRFIAMEELRTALAQQGERQPVAWYEYNQDLDAWFLAYGHNPKAKTRPLVFGDTAAPVPQTAPVVWVWNPASIEWEKVRAFGHWQQGALYAFGPTQPEPLAAPAPAPQQVERQGEQAKPAAYITPTEQGQMVWTPEMYDEACTYCDDGEFPVPLYTATPRPTSGDYALGYAEGFNDACKPAPQAQPMTNPCKTCSHFQEGKLPGVRIHDETCYECRSYWGNKWEAA